RYTMQEGLADNTVHAIYKDREGFMWFGTENGPSRFDGKVMKNFTIEEAALYITSITEDNSGVLWLLGGGRIYLF
ncbi:MAG: hypothetical protein LIP01_09940, partial [Tannerellaceae bacterium]|nr:hypothetical protein [Tannerellaceae bacterium]